MSSCMADRHLLSPIFLPVGALKESESAVDNRSMFSTISLHSIQSVSQVFVKLEQKNPAVAARTAPCPSLLAELTLATPGLLSSSTVPTTVFLATSFVEACASRRCFIRSELFTTDVDKRD